MPIILLAVGSVVLLGIIAVFVRRRSGARAVELVCLVAAAGSIFESPRAEIQVDSVAYEATASVQEAALPLTSNVGRVGERGSSTLRHHMLRRLHHRQSSDFVAANGFGVGRVRNLAPVELQEWQHDFHETEPIDKVEDLNRVVGFDLPELKTDFQLTRLELVSLLKHETPVVYVSQNLPQMDELKDAPTRPLDDFERQALERLRSDEDQVIDDTPNRIRMVGSLRAGKDCLECHSVRRGELLGAFSYELIGGRGERRSEPGA